MYVISFVHLPFIINMYAFLRGFLPSFLAVLATATRTSFLYGVDGGGVTDNIFL